MAMLISKFHRLIQSKLLWWSILTIIVLSFVVWGTVTPGQRHHQEATSPGKLDGKPVSTEDFRSAYFNSYLSVILAVGRAFNITTEIDAQLRDAAWQRIVALREAEALGLSASKDEVAAAILQNPAFHTQDGQFYKPAYKAFVSQFLAQMGFTERQFEEHVRQEIVLQKCRVALNRATLVPPYEVRRTFNSISDRFKIEYAAIGPELVTNTVHVTEADARAYFEQHRNTFAHPEKMRVRFVRFAVAPFIPKVNLAPEEIETYYNDHLDEFLAPTNRVAAETNLVVASRYLPFDEVKQDIANKMIHHRALELAADRAMEFVMDVTPDRDGNALTFEQAAAKFETLVVHTEPFALRDEVPDVDAGLEFNRAAFALGADPSLAISEPVRGEESVYVIGFEERIPSRIPEFSEVKDEVMPFAQAQAISDALGEKARELRDAAVKAVQTNGSFSEAVGAFGIPVVTTETFTASTGPTTNNYSDLLMRGILTRNQGEVTEMLPADDAVLLAYVVERIPGDPTTFDSLKQQIENTIRRQNGRWIFEGWQDYLLHKANLERRPTEAPAEEPVSEEGTEEKSG